MVYATLCMYLKGILLKETTLKRSHIVWLFIRDYQKGKPMDMKEQISGCQKLGVGSECDYKGVA